MKTIFITISRGAIAKNIFHTDVFKTLRAADIRLVFLTTAWNDKDFISSFGGQNIFFEPLPRAKWGALDNLLIGLAKGLVYNKSTELIDRYGVYSAREASYPRYILKRIFFKPLSKLRFIRHALRTIDRLLTLDQSVIKLFKKYSPDLVYSTNPSESDDAAVLKAAKHLGVRSVCMPKSWDNLSKLSFRAKADTLFAWSKFVREEAIRFQDYKENEIKITGIPHFDIYVRNPSLKSRNDFFNFIGADPGKHLLIFGSEGKVSVNDGDIVQSIISFIKNKELVKSCQLFIRPYLSFPDDEKKFLRFKGVEDVIVDRWFKPNTGFYDHWDYSREQFEFMANLLKHSEMMITSMSTLTLDASANDLPVINIVYDGNETRAYHDSMVRYYDTQHYTAVTATGAPLLVRSENELKDGINAYLLDRSLKSEGRKRLREEFCEPLDGGAGSRVGEQLLKLAGI